MKREVIARYLKHSLLFKDSTPSELASFAVVARVSIIQEGQYVYREGDPSEVFYVIAEGEVELAIMRESGVNRLVGRIGPGGHFGETGILTAKPHSLSVRALCDLVIICFDKRFFKTAFLSNNRIHRQLDVALAERLRVSFLDQGGSRGEGSRREEKSRAEDVILFKEESPSAIQLRRLSRSRNNDPRGSKTAKKTQAAIDDFSLGVEPFIISGESGTGKSVITRQIHQQSSRSDRQYQEIDLREFGAQELERKLFGSRPSRLPFMQTRRAGLLEQTSGGTLVITHADLMEESLQKKLIRAICSGTYSHVDEDALLAMQTRIGLITGYSIDHLKSTGKLLPEFLALLENKHFSVAPLRDHKEDLPRLVSHYLGRHSKEYGKNIHKVSAETLGILMNYDWPGNLVELSSVIRRAVMLAEKDEIVPDQILLGLPKTEGKWEYNILRLAPIRRLLTSSIFPRVPQIIVGCVLLITIFFLVFGPSNPQSNIGLTLGWYIGWPLMFFSFFFLARTWCSVCSFTIPGTLLQKIVKPTRQTPQFIRTYSGWIMAVLCIVVFWVEIIWNAYSNPLLTGAIILIITLGAMLFSALFSRRSWCRYLCPLGAVNAIFSMPSVVELRSNRHVCLNRCQHHACFAGDADASGCPMFRHPYLVDNNRDCIMCAKCIKSCENSSIQLNLRLAPEELWDLETPRHPDSFLVVSMGAIFFPFALQNKFSELVHGVGSFAGQAGMILPEPLVGSVLFFAAILIFQLGYYFMVTVQSWYATMDRKCLLPLFGYSFIPLILGGYMAVHLGIFVSGAGRIVPNIQEIFGTGGNYENIGLISPDSTFVLQFLTILGGLLASLYATYRVIERVLLGGRVTSRALLIPFSFLVILAALFVFVV